MGYTTEFNGQFKLNKKLDTDLFNFLRDLSQTRRMKRRGLDPKYGIDGEFYVAGEGNSDDASIVDYNSPPSTQPGLWCQWIPSYDGLHIEWDGNEKFYYYVEWLQYLIVSVLAPNGYILNGEVEWYGEERGDIGKIVVTNNMVDILNGKIAFYKEE